MIAKQARETGIRATLLGADGWDSQYIDWQAMDGGYYTNHYAFDDSRSQMRDWLSKYRNKYHAEPNIIAAAGYDTAQILARAIEVANSDDPVKIRAALQNTKDLPTLNGSIAFDQDGNPVKPAVILKIKQGKAVYETTVAP